MALKRRVFFFPFLFEVYTIIMTKARKGSEKDGEATCLFIHPLWRWSSSFASNVGVSGERTVTRRSGRLHNPDVMCRRHKCKVLSSSIVQQDPLLWWVQLVVAELYVPAHYSTHGPQYMQSLCGPSAPSGGAACTGGLNKPWSRLLRVCNIERWGPVHAAEPEPHTGRPHPPSVLICCDCCSLIIENNKAKSFLSCLVCCWSVQPPLSEADFTWSCWTHFPRWRDQKPLEMIKSESRIQNGSFTKEMGRNWSNL